jgi:prepilin-type N-terminal cleavage/methylation domain-containing protein
MHFQGLYGWFNKNLRGKKGQQGFTLIELLVVVTILGVLAGIVTLSLVGLTTNANVQACNTEYKTVQTALDAFMADNNLDSVTPKGPTQDMGQQIGPSPTAFALWVDLTSSAQTHNYTRNGITQFAYTWDKSGRIIAPILDSKGKDMTTAGCKVS